MDTRDCMQPCLVRAADADDPDRVTADPRDDARTVASAFEPIVHLGTGAIVGWAITTPTTDPALLTRAQARELLDHGLSTLTSMHAAQAGGGIGAPFLSIDLSSAILGAGSLVPIVLGALAQHAIPGSRLCVEVTQAAFITDLSAAAAELSELRAAGVRIAIAAGTPQSSLASLRHLSVDHIRLHRHATESVGRTTLDTCIAKSVLMIARELGLDVIADGVDDAEREQAMRRLGCPLGQGRHFGVPASDPKLLRRRRHHLPPHRPYPLPANEVDRLALLADAAIVDTGPEPVFDDLAREAAELCDAPLAIVAIVDAERQWHKAVHGGPILPFIAREHSIGAHAICGPDVLVVEDLHGDERFAWNPYVYSETALRFYAGAPMLASDGTAFGALCVADLHPRQLADRQIAGLASLAARAAVQIELRARLRQLDNISRERQRRLQAGATAAARSEPAFDAHVSPGLARIG
jgi:EAL domain-containing protein (putative c-di-GMP-specific phosphodiesterase class I)